MEKESIIEYFEKLEAEEEYDGYYYSVGEAITLVILGSICGLRNVRQIMDVGNAGQNKGIFEGEVPN